MILNKKFTLAKDYLGKIVDVVIDRPLGSKHPKYGFEYKANYGYIPGTVSPDGEELDAYFLAIDKSVKNGRGKVIAVIHRTNDNDDKLIVVPDGVNLSDEEINNFTYFQEQNFKSVILR